jgi:hypothetical protein
VTFEASGSQDSTFGPHSWGQYDYQFHVTPSVTGGFWAARAFGSHRWGHFPPDSEPTWYESHPDWVIGFPDEPPVDRMPASSWIRGIWQSSDSLVWIVTQVDDSLQSPVMDTLRTEKIPVAVPSDADAAYDTMIEAIDPRGGAVVAVKRFSDVYATPAGSGRMIYARETDKGLELTVVRFTLRRP